MESDDNLSYIEELLHNEEKRTEKIISLENYFNNLIHTIENEWKQTNSIPNVDYSEKCKAFLTEVQALNKELREMETAIPESSTVVNSVLRLEENNYKTTINIFLKKLKGFELLKGDEEEYLMIENEKEIGDLKLAQKGIREEINDLITNLKYMQVKSA